MKFKVNKSGFVTQVRFGRYESGDVVPYKHGILCANTYMVVWVPDGADVKAPSGEVLVSGETLVGLWEEVSRKRHDEKSEKYSLDFTGLLFKYGKQDYVLLTVASSRLYIAVVADFAMPFIQAGTHDFYLQVSSPLPEGNQEALDLAREADSPIVLAVESGRFGDLTAFVLPALIPEWEMSYLR